MQARSRYLQRGKRFFEVDEEAAYMKCRPVGNEGRLIGNDRMFNLYFQQCEHGRCIAPVSHGRRWHNVQSTAEKVAALIDELYKDFVNTNRQERLHVISHDEAASIRKSIQHSIAELRKIPLVKEAS